MKLCLDVTFAHFGVGCSATQKHAAIMTNSMNEDGQHPVRIQRAAVHNVQQAHKIFFQNPSLGYVFPGFEKI